MCVPAIPETRAYVANILGLLNGAGDPLGAGPPASSSGSFAEPPLVSALADTGQATPSGR